MQQLLPGEDVIYFGDSANVPYGNKDRSEILALMNKIQDNVLKYVMEIDFYHLPRIYVIINLLLVHNFTLILNLLLQKMAKKNVNVYINFIMKMMKKK